MVFRLHVFLQDPQDPRVQDPRVLYKHSKFVMFVVGVVKTDLGHFYEHFECKNFLSGEYHSGISICI